MLICLMWKISILFLEFGKKYLNLMLDIFIFDKIMKSYI